MVELARRGRLNRRLGGGSADARDRPPAPDCTSAGRLDAEPSALARSLRRARNPFGLADDQCTVKAPIRARAIHAAWEDRVEERGQDYRPGMR